MAALITGARDNFRVLTGSLAIASTCQVLIWRWAARGRGDARPVDRDRECQMTAPGQDQQVDKAIEW